MKQYIKQEKWYLLAITITGILYNAGMVAGPWFEGQMVQYLCDIIGGSRQGSEMLILVICYVLAILFVQFMRFIKRLYVRKFANHMNCSMKEDLYHNLLHKSRKALEQDGAGNLMTKAISDVDDCVEGVRKFTTEVFDTGVAMVAYIVMLLCYDWRLALISLIFPPIAYVIAEKLKGVVTRSNARRKESAGQLNDAVLDRTTHGVTYRVYGLEKITDSRMEDRLVDYERKSIRATILETSLQPLYQVIAMISVLAIFVFGGRNVTGDGWTSWNVAAFSTFFSCFVKLAVKSSKAAKLFNAVQKARVSWTRIKPYMKQRMETQDRQTASAQSLSVEHVSFSYLTGDEEKKVLEDITFVANPGQIIGITGEVACGKTTLGKVFLCEEDYQGHIYYGGEELSSLVREKNQMVAGYMGHQPELFSGTIRENICMETEDRQNEVRLHEVIQAVCMEQDLAGFPEGLETKIGNGGVRLSGGQQARIALARALYSQMPLLVLDDPFSAVDQGTEQAILTNIRKLKKDAIILILSHRISIFPQLDGVLWIENGRGAYGNHKMLREQNPTYNKLYEMQTGGEHHEA